MKHSRKGKIARLPVELRDQINRRLQNGEKGRPLVAWLNALPEVNEIITREFHAKPIREQNISEWRKGGYREWLVRRDALEAMPRIGAGLGKMREHAAGLSDDVALWLTARYVSAARGMENAGGMLDWERLRELCSDIVALRRGDHDSARLLLESERQAIIRPNAKIQR